MENTVLILGAGFSKPYGYPSGPELLKAIKENHLSSSKSNERDLAMAIKHYAPQSIDRFLHQNPSFYKTGIQLITAEILRYEYQSFKNRLRRGPSTILPKSLVFPFVSIETPEKASTLLTSRH